MIDLKLSNGTKLDIEYPIKLKDKNGNSVYWENSFGYWSKREYTDGNCTYWEESNGKKYGTPKSNKKQAILNQIEALKKQAEEL